MSADAAADILAGLDLPPAARRNGDEPGEDPTEALWGERWALGQLHRWAKARGASPWGVLGVSLVRLAAVVHPRVVLPPTIGGHASLNLFVALVAPSGIGKDAATGTAAAALDGLDVYTIGPGSGEGILDQYVHFDGKGDNRHLEQHRTSVIFEDTEVDTLKALAQRQASTLLPMLRKAWNGAALGFAYRGQDKKLRLAEHSYRLGFILGIQPERAGPLLAEADAGTPQRFLWLPAVDPTMALPWPEAPAPLRWTAPTWPPAIGGGGRSVLDVCDQATAAIQEAHVARHRGDGDALDGHALLCRLKVAALLAILDERAEVGDGDWHLAELIMLRSDRTRAAVVRIVEAADRQANVAQAHREADRAEVMEDRQQQRAASAILRWLPEDGGWMTRAPLRGKVPHGARPAFDTAMGHLVATGQVEAEGIEGQGTAGTRYRRVQ